MRFKRCQASSDLVNSGFEWWSREAVPMTGRRSFGALRHLPSGQWQARYLSPTGTRIAAPSTFRTKTDAQGWLAGVETDISRGRWVDPTRQEPTLGAYIEAWIPERRVRGRALAPRTIDTYRHSWNAWIKEDLGDLLLSDITSPLVRRWHSKVSSATGATATRQAYSLLKAVLNTAVQDGMLTRNPCSITGAGVARATERPLLSLDEVSLAAGAMPDHLHVLAIIAFWAHARLGELLGLQRGDVDLTRGTIRIARQQIEVVGRGPQITECKYESQRTVYLSQPARDALRRHLAATGPALRTAPLFTREDGTLLRTHHVEAAWRSARAKAALPGAHFHDLRHAGLTFVAQAGATVAELMRRGGHSSTRAALLYQHAAEYRDAELANAMTALATRLTS
jgi:integrase